MNPTHSLFSLLLFSLLSACGEREALPPEVELEDRPDQETWDVDLAIAMDGRRRARVVAPYVARFEHDDSTFARFGPVPEGPSGSAARVFVDVFDEAGEPSAVVESDRLTYLDEERRFVAEGRVVVETVEGKRLETEQLVWDEAARELRTDGFVRITTPTERLQGYRLVADESLDTYTIARPTGEVEVEEE